MNLRVPSILPADQILLVKAALWPANEALVYWQDWKRYHQLDETMLLKDSELLPKVFDPLDQDSQMLMSQVYYNLQHTTDRLIPRMRGYYRYTWLKSESTGQLFKRVVGALQQAGIEPVWMQGSALRAGYSQHSGGRRLQDAALCVPLQQQRTAIATLRKLGLQMSGLAYWDDVMAAGDDQKNFVLVQRALLPYTVNRDAEQLFWQQLQRVSLPDASTALILSPAHQIFCNLVWAFWKKATPQVQLIADCVAVVRQHSIDWTDVFQLAQQYNATYAVAAGMKLLVTDFDIQLTTAETSLLRNLSIDEKQQRYYKFLKEHDALPHTTRQKIQRIRLEYDAYKKNSAYSFGLWFLRKAAVWGIRRLT